MSKPDVFFINAFPPNDRQQNTQLADDMRQVLAEVDQLSLRHTLFTVGHKRLDPWVLAQSAMAQSERASPLIAVNPLLQHPLAVAKKLTTLATLEPRPLALNLVSGSFLREQRALRDTADFTARSERLLDFYTCLRKLLASSGTLTHEGAHFPLNNCEFFPPYSGLPVRFFISGSLPAHAPVHDDTYFVRTLKPLSKATPAQHPRSGLLLGLCARPSTAEARQALDALYPNDPMGQRLHEMSMALDPTPWTRWLKEHLESGAQDPFYCLKPLKNFWSPAPFVVGSYEEVAQVLARYVELNHQFFILDYKHSETSHVQRVLQLFRRDA